MPDITHGLAIVGPGLIGTSVAMAAGRRWPDLQVRTVDRGESLGLIGDARVVILAAPVDAILDYIPLLPSVVYAAGANGLTALGVPGTNACSPAAT